MKPRNLKKLSGRIVIGIVIIAAVGWAADLSWNGWQLYQVYRQESSLLESMSSAGIVSPGSPMKGPNVDINQVGAGLEKADRSMRAIRRDLSPVLWACDGLSGLPVVGNAFGQIDPMVSYPTHLLQAGGVLFEALGPVMESDDTQNSLNQRLFAALASNETALQTAQAELNEAAAARSGFEARHLPQKVQVYLQKVDAMMPYLQAGSALLLRAPELLGSNGPQSYLILAQNQDEMRATGGFITAIGTMQVTQGEISQFNIGDSYAIDNYSQGYPQPPAPIQKFMLAGYWVPRDGNWSPDFPTTAKEVEKLYALSAPAAATARGKAWPATAGVLAFDQSMVKAILQVSGPITLAGFAEPVTAANVEEFMHEAWAPTPEQGFSVQWWQNRKNFIPELGKAMIEEVLAMRGASQLSALGHAALNGIQQGHLEIYVNDEAAERVITQMGLDGSVAPGSGDFVMLVDSNIGFNKADAVMKRELDYRVDLSDTSSPKASVQMDYANPVSKDVACVHQAYYDLTYSQMQQRCYWDYWRVYTAGGDQLVGAQIQPVPAGRLLDKQDWNGPVESSGGEAGTLVLAGLVVVPTNQQQQVGLELRLPGRVVTAEANGFQYKLRVQKQGGEDALALKVSVTAPAGMALAAGESTQGWQAVEGQTAWVWSGTIRQTTDFVLDFVKAQN